MKLREIIYLLGLRPKPRMYGWDVMSFDLPRDGGVDYAAWKHPRWKPREFVQGAVDEIRTFLKPGDVAIDIGAHSGDSTLPIALAVGKSGCVLALEPNPHVFPVLLKLSELNRDKTSIVPLMFAATSSDGQIEFEYSDSGFCNGGRHAGISRWRHAHAFKLTVDGRNLDSYVRREHSRLIGNIKYIKIDAEGYDLEILKSIYSLLADTKPFIKAEVFTKTPRSMREEMVRFLEDLGYGVYRVVSDSNYRGERVTVSNVMRWRSYDVFCVPTEQDDRYPYNATEREECLSAFAAYPTSAKAGGVRSSRG